MKWSGQETTEACDWVIGTHVSDKWRPYAFGLIDVLCATNIKHISKSLLGFNTYMLLPITTQWRKIHIYKLSHYNSIQK